MGDLRAPLALALALAVALALALRASTSRSRSSVPVTGAKSVRPVLTKGKETSDGKVFLT